MQKLAIIIFTAVLTVCWGEFCNVCHPAGFACDSETSYRVCTGGKMLGKSIPCQYGMNCTDHPQICTIGRPACTHKCGRCNEERTMACMGPNKFALCHGKMTPSNVIIECPGNGVCNNYLEGDFCAPPSPGYREAVCKEDMPPFTVPPLQLPHMPSHHLPHSPPPLQPPQMPSHQSPPGSQMPSHQMPQHQPQQHQPQQHQPQQHQPQQHQPQQHQPQHQQHQPQLHQPQPHQPSHYQPHQHQPPHQQSPHQPSHQSPLQPSLQSPHQPSLQSPHQPPLQPTHQQPHQQSLQPSHQSPLQPGHPSHHQPSLQQPHQPSHQSPHQPQHQSPHQPLPPSHQVHQQSHQQPPHHQLPIHTTPAPSPQTTLGYPTTFNYQYHTPAPTTPAPPSTPLTPQQQCAVRGRPGRYPVDSSMCRSYLYCYVTGGSLTGQELKCPGTTVFNPDIQKCVATDTYSCAGGGTAGQFI